MRDTERVEGGREGLDEVGGKVKKERDELGEGRNG